MLLPLSCARDRPTDTKQQQQQHRQRDIATNNITTELLSFEREQKGDTLNKLPDRVNQCIQYSIWMYVLLIIVWWENRSVNVKKVYTFIRLK